MGIRFLALIDLHEAENEQHGQQLLDAFRDASLPRANYGVSIYRATLEDLAQFNIHLTPSARHHASTVVSAAPLDTEGD